MSRLKAGALTETVKIWIPELKESEYGGEGTLYYPESRPIKALVSFQRGARALIAGAVLMEKIIIVRCRRHKTFLTDRCQVEWQGERFKITKFDRVNHEDYVSLTCEKITTPDE